MFLDPLALFTGSVILDIEGITALLFPIWNLPLHGPFHSYTGALLGGVVTGVISWIIFHKLIPKTNFEFEQYSFKNSITSSLIGTFSHIVLDSLLYEEMDLLYPFGYGNPFFGVIDARMVYNLCIGAFLLALMLLGFKFLTKKFILGDKKGQV